MKSRILMAACTAATLALPAAVQADGKGHDRRHIEFEARLSGAEEVPPVETETSGRFRIAFSRDLGSAEYRLRVDDGVRVTQSHIHCGAAGTNGPVILFLAGFHANGWDVDGWWVSNARLTDANIVNPACGTTLADVLASMQAGMTYVNVHTVAHPPGEVRGQLVADH